MEKLTYKQFEKSAKKIPQESQPHVEYQRTKRTIVAGVFGTIAAFSAAYVVCLLSDNRDVNEFSHFFYGAAAVTAVSAGILREVFDRGVSIGIAAANDSGLIKKINELEAQQNAPLENVAQGAGTPDGV